MKKKLLLCFRPFVIETEFESNGADAPDKRVFTCIAVPKSPISTIEIHARKRSPRKSFSGVVKAALFEISLRKNARICSRKPPQQLTVGSKISDSSKSDAFSEISSESPESDISSTIPCSSSKSSSPMLKGSSENDKCSSNQKKQSIKQSSKTQRENRVPSCSSSSSGLFLILISLTITVFYGRICAVLFASTCLYFLSEKVPPQSRAGSSPETESSAARDNRKRVIMEGLLERRKNSMQGRRGQLI